MSHIVSVRTTLTNQSALIAGLTALGIPRDLIEVHPEPVQLTNYYGRPDQRAHLAIRKAALNRADIHRDRVFHISADLGYYRGVDGNFSLVFDDMDEACFGYQWQERLKEEYSAAVATEHYESLGYIVEVERDDLGRLLRRDDGSARLVVQGF